MIIYTCDSWLLFNKIEDIKQEKYNYGRTWYGYAGYLNDNGYKCKLYWDTTKEPDPSFAFEMDDIDYVAFKLRFG